MWTTRLWQFTVALVALKHDIAPQYSVVFCLMQITAPFYDIPLGKQAGSRDFPSDDRTVVFQLVSLNGSIYDAALSGPPTSLHPVTVNNATQCYP